ncbi:hypothetical protein [Chitinophaga rhizophila]|uniref:hypothetical protein n=1 Tax=Chitinophaga rhizophila TaxID=2866212 RepID=UPI001C69BF48|nr:hypothetical protein [Chitinophaga rhizophila]
MQFPAWLSGGLDATTIRYYTEILIRYYVVDKRKRYWRTRTCEYDPVMYHEP